MYLVNLKASFLQNPQATLKRFYYLITLGSSQAKQDWLSVQNIANPPSNKLLLEGLQMLEQLNLVDNLKTYQDDNFTCLLNRIMSFLARLWKILKI